MKSFLSSLLVSSFILVVSSIGLANQNDLDIFFNSIKDKGQWSGTGNTIIYKGPRAGSYTDLEIIVNVTKEQDNSWNVTITTHKLPPKSTTTVAKYFFDDVGLIVQAGKHTSYANDLILTPNELSFYTLHKDPVTGKEIANRRSMVIQDGILYVKAEIFDGNNELFQDYVYQVTPDIDKL